MTPLQLSNTERKSQPNPKFNYIRPRVHCSRVYPYVTFASISIILSQRTLFDTQWELGRIVKMGWTFDERSYDEHLVVLNEEGIYRVYDIQGDYAQHSLGAEAQEAGIVDAVIYEMGLVALTGQLALIEIKGWEDNRPMALASPGMYNVYIQSVAVFRAWTTLMLPL